KTSIFSHPVYLFLRKFSLQDSRGGSTLVWRRLLYGYELSYPSDIELIQITGNGRSTKDRK
ncbi:hypothetical protein, partial [Escherichia coli]|uniref:hypothetical protein n=1 Tax=Escherichia coli TaxID=562 RepID=UPI001F2D3EE2